VARVEKSTLDDVAAASGTAALGRDHEDP